MSSKKPVKKKSNFTGLVLLSLIVSFLLMYVLAVGLWAFNGFEAALRFYINLEKASQVALSGLGDTVLSTPLIHQSIEKISGCLQHAELSGQAKALAQSGAQNLKEGLSGFLSEELMSGALDSGEGFLNSAYILALKAWTLLRLITNIFLTKAFVLVASIPLFALLGTIGLIDGLSQREIRRAELGRESSYLFHMLNKWIARVIGAGLGLWLSLPLHLNPQWFFCPLGLLFAVMLSLSASKFKKYL